MTQFEKKKQQQPKVGSSFRGGPKGGFPNFRGLKWKVGGAPPASAGGGICSFFVFFEPGGGGGDKNGLVQNKPGANKGELSKGRGKKKGTFSPENIVLGGGRVGGPPTPAAFFFNPGVLLGVQRGQWFPPKKGGGGKRGGGTIKRFFFFVFCFGKKTKKGRVFCQGFPPETGGDKGRRDWKRQFFTRGFFFL